LADSKFIQWMPEPAWSRSNRWLSACTIDTQTLGLSVPQIIQRLASERIEARPTWKPMQMQPVFAHCRYYAHETPSVSQRLFTEGLCLPSGSNMTPPQQDRVIDTLISIGRR
jgi:pyridoxal phosphate-dependent aminotransferase EpsN